MNNYSADEIIALPLSLKEEAHESRSRKGRHVFISRYFLDYSVLSVEEKISLFGVLIPDDLSINSVDTPPEVQALPKVWIILGKSQKVYSTLSAKVQGAWDERAAYLNSRPLPGKLISLPQAVLTPSLKCNMVTGLHLDWKHFVRQMVQATIRQPRGGLSLKEYKFGLEKVTLRRQKFCRSYLNYNLRLTLFGQNLAKLKESEKVLSRKKSTVIHVMSLRRVLEIFTIEQLCCFKFIRGSRVHACCAKVSTRLKESGKPTGPIMNGYIMEETARHWRVRLCDNSLVDFRRGIWSRVTGAYSFPDRSTCDRVITEVWPVRLILYDSGEVQMTLIRYCYDSNTQVIDEDKCS